MWFMTEAYFNIGEIDNVRQLRATVKCFNLNMLLNQSCVIESACVNPLYKCFCYGIVDFNLHHVALRNFAMLPLQDPVESH